MISVVIADDHEIVRQGFALIINAQKDMQVMGTAADGNEAYRVTGKLKPDVLLLDEPFTGLDAALRARVAAEIRSRARLIVLVTHDAEEEALLGAGCGIALGG